MFYNIEYKRVKHDSDCAKCSRYDKATKTCNGYGEICFIYDPTTATCIDPITKLPFNPNDKENG